MSRLRLLPFALCALLAATLLFRPAIAAATLLTVTNPSFENPATGPATFVVSTTAGPFGWSAYNTTAANNQRSFGVWNPATTLSYVNGAPHGANIGVVFLMNTTGIAEAGLQQTLAATLQLSTQYTLTVEVGNFSPADNGPFAFAGFPGYRVDLLAGGTVIASDANTLAPGEGIFATSTVTFTTLGSHPQAGQTLGIRLVSLNGPGTEVNFDNVRLDATAVPEPTTAFLSFLGLLAATFRRPRRAAR